MRNKVHLKNVLAFLGVATFFWLGPPASAQTQDDNPPPRANDSRFNDTTRRELASFDQFLDSHREIAEQLRKQPSLLNNTQFVQNHPALQTYLEQHPQVRQEITENPSAFMRQEDRYDRREDARDRGMMNGSDNDRRDLDARRDNDNRGASATMGATATGAATATRSSSKQGVTNNTSSATNTGPAPQANSGSATAASASSSSQAAKGQQTAQSSEQSARDNQRSGDQDDRQRGELARFDQFLDGHRELADQIRKNPSLVNNEKYVHDNPPLESFLQENPGIRQQLEQNPSAFMQRENRYDTREDARDRNMNQGELARFDQFLDRHRELADQIRRNPSLVDDRQFVQNHPALQSFLQENPGARQQLEQNPSAFMQRENRYDTREDARDRNMNQGELARFDQFLDGHRELADQIRRNPSLVNDRQFVQNHPALQSFLQENPGARQQLEQNPSGFMQRENHYDTREDARDRNMNQGELARFDQFLDGHRELADQIRKNPSLVDDRQFVQNHPALQSFLQENPGVRQQLEQNPSGFMQRENRYDTREDLRNDRMGVDEDRDRGANRGQPSSFDRFLDSHREEAEQVRHDPSLLNNRQFVQSHPALQAYLQDHPDIREQLAQNPNGIMDRYDRRENQEASHMQQAANFRDFLGGHSTIAQDLSRDPMKVSDPDYQRTHPELQSYLSAHPDVQSALSQNPQAFMKTVQKPAAPATTTGTTGSATTGTTGSTKTPPPAPKPPMR